MALILAIESATKNCSVAIIRDGKILSIYEEYSESFSHSEQLTIFIQKAFKDSETNPKDLSAIIVDKGPGSYTGLRIGVSVAKGMSYSLNIPLTSIGSLEVLFGKAIEIYPNYDIYIPMIDARRMEVYTEIFDHSGIIIEKVDAKIIDENSFQKYNDKKVLFFGDGAEKCRSILQLKNADFITNLHPSAEGMKSISQKKFKQKEFENTAYFEPYYLKDFIAGKPKKLL